MEITIHEGSIEDIIELSQMIPEFDAPYTLEDYRERLRKDPLILVAKSGSGKVGFKVGYDKYEDGSFYSWFGAVIPESRKMGIAQKLLDHQEELIRKRGFNGIKVKTRNQHKAMIQFLHKNNYHVIDTNTHYESVLEYRILFEKKF